MDEFAYEPFCDDFGPLNFTSVVKYIQTVDQQIYDGDFDAIVCYTCEGPRALTNAAFLLGTYMLLKLDMTPQTIAERFTGLDSSLL